MRTKLRSKISLLFLTCAVLLAIPVIALADDVSNNIDPSVDAVVETMPLTVGGANGTTNLYIVERNADGKNGCNLTGSTSYSASVASSNTSVATVSPSSVTFGACGDVRTLTVTPQSAGSATISLTQTANTTAGSFNLAPATFTVNVSPPPNTAPTVTVDGVTGGASYNKGSVPNATCNVTDAEDGPSSFPATLSAITGPYASDNIGSQTASCSYTDNGPGTPLTASSSKTYGIVDPSGPVITKLVTPASPDGSNGWYKGNVTVDWTVSDPESPNSLQTTGCVDQNIITDQAAATYSCSATSAGGSAPEQSVTIKRDGTAPVITLGSASGTVGDNDWYTSAVTQTFNASDATSGLANSAQASFEQSSGAQGSNVTIDSGTVSDNAGNTASKTAGPFKIDLTNPTIVASLSPQDPAASGWYNANTGAPTVEYTCNDAQPGSGVASCSADRTFSNGENQSDTGTVFDNAGRSATTSVTNMDVDLNPPSNPTASFDRSPEDSAGGYFKDTVTVSYGGSTDVGPSGVASYTADQAFSTSGTHNYSGKATDNAGNDSLATSGTVKVDANNPTVQLTCPTAPVIKGSSASANWTASDGQSGLATASSGSVSLDTSTVGTQTASVPAGTAQDKVGHDSAMANCTYSVVFNFAGFRQPVDNGGIFNSVKAGQSIPMKFSLSGYQGLGIIALGYPKATAVACPTSSTFVDQIEETSTANNGLTYDATADQYNYVWKTPSTYAGKCYQFNMVLTDGTSHTALFKFTK
jgi:hypothetical protein